jgi:hypothetical protein
MNYPRRQINATLLPDGRVLVTGGSSCGGFDTSTTGCPVLPAEVWDPATGTWTVWSSQASYHGYHSTAVLVPDGRVLMGGGRYNHLAQVFSPPYLFTGARPTIASAPAQVLPGQTFFVGTPDAATVTDVTLLRLGSVSHAFNMNQRFNRLAFSVGSGGLNVTAPASNNLAPPGHYLLFILQNGVPSVAQVIQLGQVSDGFTKAIVFSDSWKYDDTNTDRGTAWIAGAYDDSGWKTGPAKFGFGGYSTEATLLTRGAPTYYFRKQIQVNGTVSSANIDLVFDDGVTVWLNGTQVFTQYMSKGTAFPVFASKSVHDTFTHVSLPASAFVSGTNTIAVEVKNVSATSSDVGFDLALNLLLSP